MARVVGFLLECGEDPNPQDSQGKTPLHVAAALGNREIVELLLTSGAHIFPFTINQTMFDIQNRLIQLIHMVQLHCKGQPNIINLVS